MTLVPTRREVIQAASASLAVPYFLTSNALGNADTPPASERLRFAAIGVGNQGSGNLGAVLADCVAVCDVDKTRLAAAQARVEKVTGKKCAAFTDYRKVLEMKDVDAVLITTPDHWHALPTVHACEAGKDVYIEKPLSLTVAEGRAMTNAARKYKRIVQTGSQQRSSKEFRLACELVRSGRIGKLKTVRVGIPGNNFKGPAVPDAAAPGELDYEMWLGPAPERPYNVNRVHYKFRFFWDYSGGQMTNFGAHHLDIAQWGLGMDASGPVSVENTAAPKFHKDNWYEVPDFCEVTLTYADGVKVIVGQGQKSGATFEGEKGTIHVNRGKLESNPAEIIKEPLKEGDVHLYTSKGHHADWKECIKTRKLPICDVEIGHRSATVCHLANIAIRSGKKLTWDPIKETFGDAELDKWLSRPYRAPWTLPNHAG